MSLIVVPGYVFEAHIIREEGTCGSFYYWQLQTNVCRDWRRYPFLIYDWRLRAKFSWSKRLMQQTIVDQGLELMLFGMSTVVLFLTLLVIMTMAMSRFISRFFPEAELEVVAASNKPRAQPADQELVAVISAALHRHRSGQ